MTSPSVQFAIDRILQDEGGIKDVGDGKGVTRFGQTPTWLDDNGFVPPANAADAAVNYAAWMTRFQFDRVSELDRFVGWMLADFAVHSGEREGVKGLQRALGVKDDGVLGPITLQAVRVAAGSHLLARKLLSQRMRYVGKLLGSDKTDRRKWAHGWLNRLADHVEELP